MREFKDLFLVTPPGGEPTIHNKDTIRNIPDKELDAMITTAYDRWNWDTGDPKDRKLLDILEEERKERREMGVKVEGVKTSMGMSAIRRVPIE